uniref:Uncharacterized protein n=1 Tax=Schizaphis graminum TaxID=13262 RepID=A0A2S2NAA2_SCHGA
MHFLYANITDNFSNHIKLEGDNNLKKCSSSVIENERENLNSDNDVNSSKQDIKDIENVDTMAIVETYSNIDNGDSNLKKYNSTAIENERENLNSDNDINSSKQDIKDIENVDTMAIVETEVETCSNIDNDTNNDATSNIVTNLLVAYSSSLFKKLSDDRILQPVTTYCDFVCGDENTSRNHFTTLRDKPVMYGD